MTDGQVEECKRAKGYFDQWFNMWSTPIIRAARNPDSMMEKRIVSFGSRSKMLQVIPTNMVNSAQIIMRRGVPNLRCIKLPFGWMDMHLLQCLASFASK